ncbi:MAG: helix-turn-helix domain-containing protein [Deltaproteobacteria bacterium]|nr:helix-turn-helix domain-containing protein [Deltaproteobacteria bacterium]
MTSLLTPPEVAHLLQISLRTVYAQSRRLGGFYPAGIRALRFRREDIYAIMERPNRTLEVSISTSRQAIQPDRLQDQGRSPGRPGRASQRNQDGGRGTADPSIVADAIRFGLRDPDGGIPASGRKGLSSQNHTISKDRV